jgi:hypothetical protein
MPLKGLAKARERGRTPPLRERVSPSPVTINHRHKPTLGRAGELRGMHLAESASPDQRGLKGRLHQGLHTSA